MTPAVSLHPVDAENWRDVAAVAPHTDQAGWVAPVTRYLCLCHDDGAWQPLVVRADGLVVGFVMWAFDEDEGSHWIGGLVVDAAHQGRGIGRAAVQALLAKFGSFDDHREAALSYGPTNTVARDLYRSLGFVETGEEDDGELVARRPQA